MKKSLGIKTTGSLTPVWIIGSYDAQYKANIMAVAWGGFCCSKPPMVTISLRKATYTYDCIMSRKAYTVNIPSVDQLVAADYVGIYSGRNHNKFEDCSLTEVKSDLVDAPIVKEFPVVIECRLERTVELGYHTMFVGEIADVKVDDTALDADGKPDIAKIQPIVYSAGCSVYHAVGDFLGKAYDIGKKVT